MTFTSDIIQLITSTFLMIGSGFFATSGYYYYQCNQNDYNLYRKWIDEQSKNEDLEKLRESEESKAQDSKEE